METRKVEIEAPYFPGWECVAVCQCAPGDFVISQDCHRIVQCHRTGTYPEAIYRRMTKPKAEIICSRCGLPREEASPVSMMEPCLDCGSRLWDFADTRENP